MTNSLEKKQIRTMMRRPSQNERFFENFWTVTDLAEYLSVREKTVYDWVHKREIPFQKVNRLLRFRPSDIEKWLSSKGGSHVNRSY